MNCPFSPITRMFQAVKFKEQELQWLRLLGIAVLLATRQQP